ncbi:MAG: hypothetical protein N3A69_09650, partial [Leptospiraceae bacterium]|nr:hypothetical protein [Leptospiraceae bacterium]
MYKLGNESNLFFEFIVSKFVKLKRQPLFFWIFCLIVFISLARAISFRWVCDDAFISFRYAKNLMDGLGLVFNTGEFVEGYTNFLWTIGISLGMLFRIDPLRWVQFWGLVFFVSSIFLLYILSIRLSEEISENTKYFFPLAAFSFALQTHAQIYATGGLETSFFGFLILL